MILTENSDGSCHGMFSVFCHYFNLSEWVEMLQAQDDSENKIRSQVITKAAATALQITTDGNSISIWTCQKHSKAVSMGVVTDTILLEPINARQSENYLPHP